MNIHLETLILQQLNRIHDLLLRTFTIHLLQNLIICMLQTHLNTCHSHPSQSLQFILCNLVRTRLYRHSNNLTDRVFIYLDLLPNTQHISAIFIKNCIRCIIQFRNKTFSNLRLITTKRSSQNNHFTLINRMPIQQICYQTLPKLFHTRKSIPLSSHYCRFSMKIRTRITRIIRTIMTIIRT